MRDVTRVQIHEPEETPVTTDPQPPPADLHDVAQEAEVDAGLASPHPADMGMTGEALATETTVDHEESHLVPYVSPAALEAERLLGKVYAADSDDDSPFGGEMDGAVAVAQVQATLAVAEAVERLVALLSVEPEPGPVISLSGPAIDPSALAQAVIDHRDARGGR